MPYTIATNASDKKIQAFLIMQIDFASPVRYTDADLDILALSHTWTKGRGFLVNGIATTQGDTGGAEIVIDNADNAISAILFGATSPTGALVQVWEAWFDPENNDTVVPDDTKKLLLGRVGVLKLDPDPKVRRATISVSPYCEFRSVVMPRRKLTPKCTFVFKEANSCQYAGANTSCLRTKIDCNSKSNASNFGGFEMITGGTAA